jgi:hypothetical protein
LKQLWALKQVGSVAEYHARFEELSHGIILYNASYDETFFVTQLLAGLKEEIRAVFALHSPKSVPNASELATNAPSSSTTTATAAMAPPTLTTPF